jgi:CHAD domain-containing protein
MEEKQKSSGENTNLIQEVYKARWRAYRIELKRCQTEPTEESVHDLRVATRRLLALIDLLRAIAPHPRLQNLRSTLKNQLDDMGELRDTQVMLVETSEVLAELPEIEPFQKFLNKRERHLLRSTAKAIKGFKYSGVRKRMDSVRKKILKQKLGTILNSLLLQAVDNRFGVVLRRLQLVDPANPATIHRMRVSFKKFRYMVEIVHPLVPNYPEDNFKHMHDYQGAMGDIQDMEVLLSTLEDFAERDISYDPEPVLRYYQQRSGEFVNAFIEDMHQVNTFWRADSDVSFPWESEEPREKSASTEELPKPPPDWEKNEKKKQAEAGIDTQKNKHNFSVQ